MVQDDQTNIINLTVNDSALFIFPHPSLQPLPHNPFLDWTLDDGGQNSIIIIDETIHTLTETILNVILIQQM